MSNTGALSGHTLGQYELRELLGRGGMGAVYRAYQHSLKREVAVKVLSDQLLDEPDYLERFNAEARTAAALEHPHIVPIHDFGTQDGLTYVVMRYLTGGSLHERMRTADEQGIGRPSMAEIALLLAQVASALDYAHHEGVVHRDIKPQNIMFDNHGKPYVVDFGIAKLLHQTAMTMSGMALGSPSYMPPEQWRGEGISGASDQYALAVTIYSLVAGRLPFEGDSQQQLMYKHLSEMPPPIDTTRPDLPPALTLVMNRALAKEASERFPNCTQFSQAFSAAVEGLDGEATNYFVFKLPKAERKPATVSGRPSAAATPSRSVSQRPATMPAQPTTYPPAPAPVKKSSRTALYGVLAVAVVAVAVLLFALIGRGGGSGADATATAAALTAAPGIALLTEVSPTSEPSATPTEEPSPTATATATDEPTPTEAVTMDALAIAQATRDGLRTAAAAALQSTAFQATIDFQLTAFAFEDQTATATVWTPTATETPTDTPSPTATPTATPTDTATAAPTETATSTPTATPTATDIATSAPTVTVNAAFAAQQDGLTVSFRNLSTGQIASVLWRFGDGETSTERSLTHTYGAHGTYLVTLTVTDGAGGADSAIQTLTLAPAQQSVTVNAAFAAQQDGLTITFSNLSTGPATAYLWRFGDGETSTERSPTHTYGAHGTYLVTLTVTDGAGSADSAIQTLTLAPPEQPGAAVNAAFAVRQDGMTVSFRNLSTGQIASVLWQFGDGENSTVHSPTHVYLAFGTYTVTLRVTDNLGNSDTTTQSVRVAGSAVTGAPNAAFAVRQDGMTVSFRNLSTGQIASRLWQFGDGNNSTLHSPTHVYRTPGSYTVTLRVSDNFGNTNTTTQTVTVSAADQAAPPDVDAYYVQYDTYSVVLTYSSSGEVSTVRWQFGDGNVSEQHSPFHNYGRHGTYTVTLTASGPGGEETVTETVEVAPGCGISAFEGRSANMRAELSADSEQVGVIGSQARVFTSRAGRGGDGFTWYYVYHDGAIGWVRSDVVRVVDGTCPTA